MWYNVFIIWLMHSPLGGLLDKNLLLVTYVGRKSGKRYTIPVNYLRINPADPNELTTLSLRTRTWWCNLLDSRPYHAQLQRKDYLATAEVIVLEASVVAHLRSYLKSVPQMARYFNVRMENGLPNAVDLARAAKERVVILTRVGGLFEGKR